jgi:lysophospholipase L1-like esterase
MKAILITITVFVLVLTTNAQPFSGEIQAFKKQDSLSFPVPNQILLIGSSSFRLWKDVQNSFPTYPIVNRAFGGSTLPDIIRYRYEVIYAYQPKQILIYCGENDFASSDTVTVATVVNRYKQLHQLIRAKFHAVPIGYVSMKPSPSRQHLLPKYKEANYQIQQFLATDANATFINVYKAMLNSNGQPMPDLFIADNLHMNAKGYSIWQKIILPYLVKQ